MIELVLTACLLTGAECRDVSLERYQSAYECMVSAQPMAASWLARHPGLTVVRFRCGPVERGA
jgi:hypothetical protein